MKKAKKKAFTLTELLVVVIVIGVLAAVTLPTFNKVLETRKTTEAEDVLAALRTEQEYRCAMEKPYATDLNKLDTLASNTKKNFDYKIVTKGNPQKGTGSKAISQGKYNYALEMPSYADGRICCSGADCSKLNKDYPTCDSLEARADFKPAPANCSPDVDDNGGNNANTYPSSCGAMPDNLIKYQQCQDTNKCGREVKKPICNAETDFVWKEGTTWDNSACTDKPSAKDPVYCEDKDANTCGEITYEAKCQKDGTENWKWNTEVEVSNTCEAKPDNETDTCKDGTVRTGTYQCKNHSWEIEWDVAECPEDPSGSFTCSEKKGEFSCGDNQEYDSGANGKLFSGADEIELEENFMGTCCKCKEGFPVNEGTYCTTCGKNFKWNGKECVRAFEPHYTSEHVVFGNNPRAVYHMANTEWCLTSCNPYINASQQIQPCSSYGSVASMCDRNCDANESTCMAACYEDNIPSFDGDGYEFGYKAASGDASGWCRVCCCNSGCAACAWGGGELSGWGTICNYSCVGQTYISASMGSCTGGCKGISIGRNTRIEIPETYYLYNGQRTGPVPCNGNTPSGYYQCTYDQPASVQDCYVPQVKFVRGYTCGAMQAKGHCSSYGYY